MTTIYRDADASLDDLQGLPVTIVGFGNQGQAQALNLRDSGVEGIVVANREDDYRERAAAAGFPVMAIPDGVRRAGVVLLLIPDEVQPQVFRAEVAPNLATGSCLVVASGYNLAFGLLDVPPGVDVVMVAPRMIGAAVRSLYAQGKGFPCFVSVERDATGRALALALAVARGIGATRAGAIGSSAREEAALDLFSEQAVWPVILSVFRAAYDVLHAEGFSDEAVLSELYLSGEPAEVMTAAAEVGLFEQLALHSQTSQYGQLRSLLMSDESALRARFAEVMRGSILSGTFALEWSSGSEGGPDRIAPLREQALAHPLVAAERKVRDGLARRLP